MVEVSPRLVRDDGAVERVGPLAPPPDLVRLLSWAHGAETAAAFEVPAGYAGFLRTHDGGLRTLTAEGEPDEYGWYVLRFSQALSATTGMYERVFASDDPEERADQLRCMRGAGMWLEIGGHGDRHYHYLCCDRTRETFGRVHDANDGDPSTGLVTDREWASFGDYVDHGARRNAGSL